MALDLNALKTELETDPSGIGYATPYAAGTWHEVADLVNANVAGSVINRTNVSVYELQEAVIGTEFAALADVKQRGWLAVLSGSQAGINPQTAGITDQIADIWGAGTTTRDNLVALKTREGSRSEQLFGENVSVTFKDVQAASELP